MLNILGITAAGFSQTGKSERRSIFSN